MRKHSSIQNILYFFPLKVGQVFLTTFQGRNIMFLNENKKIMLQMQNYNTHGANYYSYLYIFLLHISMLLILWKTGDL